MLLVNSQKHLAYDSTREQKTVFNFWRVLYPKNSKEKGLIHDCPSETSFIKSWPGPYLGFAENDSELGQSGACKGQNHKVKYFLPVSNGGKQTSQRTSHLLLPVCDQAHSMRLEQSIDLLKWKHRSCLTWTIAPSVPGGYLSLGKRGLQVNSSLYRKYTNPFIS